ncbi:helix-turn-helix domain-containing protein [Brevibacillus fluminis]|uniref:helix-turn-helix domain-containing protein n=1 Tax=Brevibacillus fluminis TaxID=511487 RepID=UPI003F8C8BBA
MNYIREINAFYDRLETNPLSTSAIALWHALMQINNKAGWIDTFAVAVSVLCVKTGLSERTITNARNELKQKGYIDFLSRKGNKSATYKIESLSAIISDKLSDNKTVSAINADSASDFLSCTVSDSVSCNPSALNKQNNTRGNETNNYISSESDDLLSLINQLGISCKGAYQLDELTAFVGLMDVELVKEALRRSEKKSVAYAISILNGWNKEKINTFEQLQTQKTRGSWKKGNVRLLSDKLPASVQRQLQREQEKTEPNTATSRKTVLDDPELKRYLDAMRARQQAK